MGKKEEFIKRFAGDSPAEEIQKRKALIDAGIPIWPHPTIDEDKYQRNLERVMAEYDYIEANFIEKGKVEELLEIAVENKQNYIDAREDGAAQFFNKDDYREELKQKLLN